jgi:DNA invertase Pin-like site-specific DNA recombinase
MLIGYARVSTLDQNPALQVDALKAAGCERVFTEKASGAQRDRPMLSAALDHLREGDVLVVWKLDRLARSMRQLLDTVENLAVRKVGFRCLTAAIDTTTPEGRLFFHMIAAMAEFERDMIRERTRAGLDVARAAGRKGGRPPKLSDADLKVARALLSDASISVADIAKRLRVSVATFYKYLPAARSRAIE